MYTSLGLALGQVDFELNHVVECVLTFIYCVVSIVCLITSLSDVPSAMSDASILFQNVYNKEILKAELLTLDPPGLQRLMTIKALRNLNPVYVTVWDMLKVDRSLLLSTFGCILTFGILIMQLQRTNEE
ncbi:uncharacterized protein CEXT_451791 [Caerostris extrusa]|uniref:Gustatory receptor n=1 Tax=Caerostris extrusa TaxID=172846 RepID=A0AAV4W485_CAEEX|nr:uncharacterized protein CEXT_451791 [Caerostris extrusa]